jgi:hypothetical protein
MRLIVGEREKDSTFSAETYVSHDNRVCVIARAAGGAPPGAHRSWRSRPRTS